MDGPGFTFYLVSFLTMDTQQQNETMSNAEAEDSLIAALLVVGFHHAYGPIVEFCVPPLPKTKEQDTLEKLDLPEEWSFLPFLALPGKYLGARLYPACSL